MTHISSCNNQCFSHWKEFRDIPTKFPVLVYGKKVFKYRGYITRKFRKLQSVVFNMLQYLVNLLYIYIYIFSVFLQLNVKSLNSLIYFHQYFFHLVHNSICKRRAVEFSQTLTVALKFNIKVIFCDPKFPSDTNLKSFTYLTKILNFAVLF